MDAAGIAGPVAYGDFTSSSGAHAMAWLLDRAPRLDGVFAASDAMAVGAMQALRRADRRVPEDVAIVGYDDAPLAVHASLTTIRQPVEELGGLLRNCCSTRGTESPILPAELVVRATT